METIKAEGEDAAMMNYYVEAKECVKYPIEHNPLMTQEYSADPYAMVYDGRVEEFREVQG